MATQMLVHFVQRINIRIGEEGRNPWRLQHINKDQVLAAVSEGDGAEATGIEEIEPAAEG